MAKEGKKSNKGNKEGKKKAQTTKQEAKVKNTQNKSQGQTGVEDVFQEALGALFNVAGGLLNKGADRAIDAGTEVVQKAQESVGKLIDQHATPIDNVLKQVSDGANTSPKLKSAALTLRAMLAARQTPKPK